MVAGDKRNSDLITEPGRYDKNLSRSAIYPIGIANDRKIRKYAKQMRLHLTEEGVEHGVWQVTKPRIAQLVLTMETFYGLYESSDNPIAKKFVPTAIRKNIFSARGRQEVSLDDEL